MSGLRLRHAYKRSTIELRTFTRVSRPETQGRQTVDNNKYFSCVMDYLDPDWYDRGVEDPRQAGTLRRWQILHS